jgi:predicted transcriptional regulator
MEPIKQPAYALRVHIAPVGFEIDRVAEPLVRMKADKVYLFAEKTENHEKLEHFITEIKKRLENNNIAVEQRGWDLKETELYATLREYRKIIDEEEGNDIFINVSTGSKIHAIAGMIASMIFKDGTKTIMPYYVIPESYADRPANNEQYTSGCKEIKTLPNYRIEKPADDIMDVLMKISEIGKTGIAVTKKILIEELEKSNIALTTDSKNEAGKYNALQRKYLKPLTDWGYIRLDSKTKRSRIEVTEEGKNALMFLRD